MTAPINYADIFAGSEYDAPKEIYLATMERMDDKSLLSYCRTSPYIAQLCRDDDFWLRRIQQRELSALLPYRSLYKDLREFYLNVRKDAVYIVTNSVILSIYARAFNSATEARRYIDGELRRKHVPAGTELDYDTLNLPDPYYMGIFFKDREITNLSDYDIFSLDRNSPKYLANITRYPTLASTGYIIRSVTKDYNPATDIANNYKYILTSFTDAAIQFFNKRFLESPNTIGGAKLLVLKVDDVSRPLVWHRSPFGLATIIKDDYKSIGTLLITNVNTPGVNRDGINRRTTNNVIVALYPMAWDYIDQDVEGTLAAGTVFQLEELDLALDYLRNQ